MTDLPDPSNLPDSSDRPEPLDMPGPSDVPTGATLSRRSTDILESAEPPAHTAGSGGAADEPVPRRSVVARFVQILATLAVFAALLFGVAGTWDWPEAWLLIGLYASCTLVAAVAFAPQHQAVIAARAHSKFSEAPRWDRYIAVAWSLLSVAVPAVGALEYRWQGPGTLPPALTAIGAAGFVAAYALTLWSMAANPFFETVVRIQHERGHVTVTGGPYAIIRHPGYVGAVGVVLTMPLILRTPWALAPALLGGAVIIARTALEDRFLQARLEGYADYARRVRYRLVPGLW
jgi:protein-S-isoprenylcysteine O-methyltransferase Ste14